MTMEPGTYEAELVNVIHNPRHNIVTLVFETEVGDLLYEPLAQYNNDYTEEVLTTINPELKGQKCGKMKYIGSRFGEMFKIDIGVYQGIDFTANYIKNIKKEEERIC